jgi:hypothetical protein
MQNPKFNFFLLIIGLSGMVLSAFFDLIKGGALDFGITQFAGFVVSAIIAIAGLHKMGVLRSKIWIRLLVIVYSTGILFMGLRPTSHTLNLHNGMFQSNGLSFTDVAINIVGFAPLGYFMMSWLLSTERLQKKINPVLLSIVVCTGISLLIEALQYYIPGRTSSASDVFFNGLGALGGTLFCLFEKKNSQKDSPIEART